MLISVRYIYSKEYFDLLNFPSEDFQELYSDRKLKNL